MIMIFAGVASWLSGLALSTTTCQPIERAHRERDGFEVTWMEYAPKSAKVNRTILVLPPTGGTTPLDRRYARGLCRRGLRVMVSSGWTGLGEPQSHDLQLHNRLFGRAHRAIKILREQQSGAMSLLGTSLGSLYGLSAMVQGTLFDRAVLIVGGVPFTDIIARSDTVDMNILRKKRWPELQLKSTEDYVDRLNAVFKFNDLDKITSELEAHTNFMLVVGEKDVGVPTANQRELVRRLPHAKVLRYQSSHVATIVKSFLWSYYDVIRFLR